jgi:hypothetical protein
MQAFFLEHELRALELRDHAVARDELAAQDLLRERIFDLRLDGPLQGPGAVDRVEARLADLVAGIILEPQLDVALRQTLAQAALICARPREWNTTISSTRLMNSGRKCWVTTCITAAFIFA